MKIKFGHKFKISMSKDRFINTKDVLISKIFY